MNGPDKDQADVLSRIPLINSEVKDSDITRKNLSEIYSANKFEDGMFPLIHGMMYKYNWKDTEQVDKTIHRNYHTKYFP